MFSVGSGKYIVIYTTLATFPRITSYNVCYTKLLRAVMKINSELGYRPVTFSELTDDEQFWKGCQSCVNYDILTRTNRKHCLCTGMLYDPVEKYKHQKKSFNEYKGKYAKWLKEKRDLLFKKFKKINIF